MSGDGLTEQLERARELGFLGPGPVAPHIAHAVLLAEMLESSTAEAPMARALDLGSGGGLPGLVLAMRWPTSTWVLLDANERRSTFLRAAAETLGVAERCEVWRGRAEVGARDVRLRGQFDLVTSRSFGPPAVAAECAAGFLRDGGVFAVSEPPEVDPDRWPDAQVATLGLSQLGAGPWRIFRRTGDLADWIPRREGVPAKRPLW